jgi:hypothetical protein
MGVLAGASVVADAVVLRSLNQYYHLLTFLILILILIRAVSQSLQPPMILLKLVHSLDVAVCGANLQKSSPEVSGW